MNNIDDVVLLSPVLCMAWIAVLWKMAPSHIGVYYIFVKFHAYAVTALQALKSCQLIKVLPAVA
jgi:hypothetical protein